MMTKSRGVDSNQVESALAVRLANGRQVLPRGNGQVSHLGVVDGFFGNVAGCPAQLHFDKNEQVTFQDDKI